MLLILQDAVHTVTTALESQSWCHHTGHETTAASSQTTVCNTKLWIHLFEF